MTTNPSSLINKRISLISKLNIRYEGILYSVDPAAQSVALANVRSFGTEERESEKFIPPSQDTYEFIIFRGSDIKDLLVPSERVASPPRIPQYDPAIVASGAPGMHNQNHFGGYMPPSSYGMGISQNQSMTYPSPYGNWGGYGSWEPNRQQFAQTPISQPHSQLGPPLGPPIGVPISAIPYGQPSSYKKQQHDTSELSNKEGIFDDLKSADSNGVIHQNDDDDQSDPNSYHLDPPNLVQQVENRHETDSFFDLPAPSTMNSVEGQIDFANSNGSEALLLQNQLYPLEEAKKDNRQHKQPRQQNQQREPQQRQQRGAAQNRRQGGTNHRRPNQDTSPSTSTFTRKDERQGIGRGKRVNTSQWKEREHPSARTNASSPDAPPNLYVTSDTEVGTPSTATTNSAQTPASTTKANYRERGRNRTNKPRNNNSSASPNPRRQNARGGYAKNIQAQQNLFDLEGSTAAFDKESVFLDISQHVEDIEDEESGATGYDSTAFFDMLSCEATERTTTSKPLDRAEQRKLDIETFGSEANKIRYGRPPRSNNTTNSTNLNTTPDNTNTNTNVPGRSTTHSNRGRGRNTNPHSHNSTPTNSNNGSSSPSPDRKPKRFVGRGRRANTNKVFRQKNTEGSETEATTTTPTSDNNEQQ